MIERKHSSQTPYERNRNFTGLSINEIESRTEEFCRRIDNLLSATCTGTVTPSKLRKILGLKFRKDSESAKGSELILEAAKKLQISSAWTSKPLFSLEEAKKIAGEFAKEEVPQKKTKSGRKGNEKNSTVAASMKLSEERRNYSILDIGRSMGFDVYESAKIVKGSGLIRKTAQNLGIAAAYERKPNFSLEEAKEIVDKLTSEKFRKISRENLSVIKNSVDQVLNENRTILFRERKVVLPEISPKEMDILKILIETSEENPISVSLLARKIYSNEVELKVARLRICAFIHNLRGKLKKYDLGIVTKITEINTNEKDKISYYLVDKNDFVKASSLEEKSVKNEIPAKGDIFVKTEISIPVEEIRLQEKFAESPILIQEPSREPNPEQNSESSLESNPELEIFPPVTPFFNEVLRKEDESNSLPSPLEDGEIYVTIRQLYYMNHAEPELRKLFVNMEPLEAEEVKRLVNRVMVRLGHARNDKADFLKESLLSVRGKLEAFMEHPKEYFNSCKDKASAQFLLSCFDVAKINKVFLNRLLSEKPESERKAKAKMEA